MTNENTLTRTTLDKYPQKDTPHVSLMCERVRVRLICTDGLKSFPWLCKESPPAAACACIKCLITNSSVFQYWWRVEWSGKAIELLSASPPSLLGHIVVANIMATYFTVLPFKHTSPVSSNYYEDGGFNTECFVLSQPSQAEGGCWERCAIHEKQRSSWAQKMTPVSIAG